MLTCRAWLDWLAWAGSPASSYGQGQVDSEGREKTTIDFFFLIVSEWAVPLLWALLTGPGIVIIIHVHDQENAKTSSMME